MLHLYSVHDDPSGCVSDDERWWCLVWAATERDAQLIAAGHYTGDAPTKEQSWGVLLQADCLPAFPEAPPVWPCRETRREYLRLAGWREGDESYCSCCGLAPMGIPLYAVCPECDQCVECGHEAVCPECRECVARGHKEECPEKEVTHAD